MADVTGTRRAKANGRQLADHGFKGFKHLLESRRLIPADIHCADLDLRFLDGLHQHVHQILDVDKIPSLLAITEHGDRQAFLRALAENADHTGVWRRRILTRAEDVEEAENHRFQTMLAAIEIEVMLARQ